jgi:hypothetical protein
MQLGRLLPPWLLMGIILGGCVRAGFDGSRVDAVGGGDGACSWSTFSTPQKIANVNMSSSTDWAPHLAADGLTLYFGSDRHGGEGAFDVWVASRATVNDTFGPPTNLAVLNTDANDSEPATSVDGLEIYIYRSGYGILRATRPTTTAQFSSPAAVTGLLPPGKQSVAGPVLAADGLTLYYHACTKQAGSCDLAVATRPAPGAPFSHARLLDEVNAPGEDDGWPTVSASQLELYFEATRASVGTRVFVATRASVDDPFGPVSVVQELAVADGSGDPDLSPDGRTMVLAVESSHVWDLYVATRECLP